MPAQFEPPRPALDPALEIGVGDPNSRRRISGLDRRGGPDTGSEPAGTLIAGATPVNRGPTHAPTSVAELRHRILTQIFSRLLRVRRTFEPLMLGFAVWIAVSDSASWRRAALAAVSVALLVLIAADFTLARDTREGRLPPSRFLIPNFLAIGLLQHVLIFASGGMVSPALPLILPVLFLAGLHGERRAAWLMALCVHLPMLWLEAGVQLAGLVELRPDVLRSLGEPAPALLISLAAVMTMATLGAIVMSTTAAEGIQQMVTEALHARDTALANHAEQTRALTTLSGEIAHELKNPLASVKGLAALIERNLASADRDRPSSPDKARERVQVLRREVDRMQGILDEFLNFSRPLVPLDQREVDLRELADRVVELHEGMAREREVDLRIEGRAPLRCDPRKIEQILINLLQNALEVAPARSTIELAIAIASDDAMIAVRDAGPGLTPELRDRVFEAGVTGSAEGSGLGLTIARSIARQHGGELELRNRADTERGCEARLRLPITGLAVPEPDPGAHAHA